jgi:hypothetical protein
MESKEARNTSMMEGSTGWFNIFEKIAGGEEGDRQGEK